MAEQPHSMMDDIREVAAEVAEYPSYLRTQSSVARFERDRQRFGCDPRFGRSAVARALEEQIQAEQPATDTINET